MYRLLLLGLTLFLCAGCSFSFPSGEDYSWREYYSDYVLFTPTKDGFYGELDLTLYRYGPSPSIKFFGPLTITDEDRESVKIGEKYSGRAYNYPESECIAANYAHNRSKFQGKCRITIQSKNGSWELSQESVLALEDLRKYGELLFQDPNTQIIRNSHSPVPGCISPNILVGSERFADRFEEGVTYRIKVLISGEDPEKLPKGFFICVDNSRDPFVLGNSDGDKPHRCSKPVNSPTRQK